MTTTFARRITQVKPSLTLGITAKAKAMQAEGKNVISFGAGEPDFDTPRVIRKAAEQALRDGHTRYTPESGIQPLRAAIADKLKRENNIEYQPEEIVVSCGAKHSIYNAVQVLVDEEDEVILPSPYWLSYPEMVTLAGGKVVTIAATEESDFKITPAELERAITPRTKLFILNSPSNPTGAVYTEAELRAIAEVLRQKNIFIISDEIYEKLIYDGVKHFSIASIDSEIRSKTVTVNGHSKTYAMTGWRIGYLAAPREIAKAVSTLQSHSTSNPTSFAQYGALEAFKLSGEDIEKFRKKFERRRNLIFRLAKKVPRLAAFKPSGAFYLFCDISDTGLTSMQFSERLLEEKQVAVVPGVVFGSDKHIRMSFATSEDLIKEGIERIAEWIRTL